MSTSNLEIEVLKEEYLSQIKGVFPFYRLLLLFVAMVVVIAVQDAKFKSVSEGLLHLQLRSFADLDKGFFSSITVQDALIAIAILALGVLLHRLIRWLSFAWMKKNLSLDKVAKQMNERSMGSKDGTIVSYFALKRAESQADMWGRNVSLFSLMSESAVTLFLVFFYAGFFGNLIDYSVSFGFLVFAISALARSFIVFLKYYLPHTMHAKGLSGGGGNIALP